MDTDLGPDLPESCRLAKPELHCHELAVAKYGILDLRYSISPEALAGEPPAGLSVLRELGYLPGGDAGPQVEVCDDPICLEMLQE